MALEIEYLIGQTPLDEDEKEGLLIKSITNRGELDEFEQKNIEDAITWSIGKNFSMDQILIEDFVKSLHKKMYEKVWGWAGNFRKTNKNIGVDKHEIGLQLRQLLDDTKYWINEKVYPPDEIAIRFKHRIVNIHCFPNGNGRHSRLIADILIHNVFKSNVFSWGSGSIAEAGEIRNKYLNAIWAGDAGNMDPLLIFARS